MTLAIRGGKPVRELPMPPRPQYGIAERNAANEVVSSGNLSGFLATDSRGGPRVESLEEAWCEKFNVKYAVTMNSATSCLFGALKATTTPRGEVVVSPWSMSASATCAREAGCSPVFTDIETETYSIVGSNKITAQTTAIVLVHLFGCPARYTIALQKYARKHGIVLIEDAAQAPGATWTGGGMDAPQSVGTFGDVGVFSLNRHKTIECGEGGVAVTNSEQIAEFLRGYRNHGEVRGMNRKGYWGGNYRLGEIEAAIAEVQLGRLEELTEPRIENAGRLTEALSELDGIYPPTPPRGLRHVYYLYPVRLDPHLTIGENGLGITAAVFASALRAEGIPASAYVEPIYRLPVFSGFARQADVGTWEDWYPVVEACYRNVLVLDCIHGGMTSKDIDDVIAAFRKVWEHRESL